MHFLALAVLVYCGVAVAQVTDPTQRYNITSPIPNQSYVAGQGLPLIFDVFSTANAPSLTLSVTLTSSTNASFPQTVIASQLDASQSSQFARTVNNVTVYEHQQTWPIPTSVAPGSYNVIVTSDDTKTNTTIPISINAVAVTTSASASGAQASGTGAIPGASAGGILGSSGERLHAVRWLLGMAVATALFVTILM
ncbi:hypothetical protein BZG36_04093 [Bifiguratus adelaidae]|uniref:Uncharacterized protein n=1 Tax=Bifiguratus adelaidae TaxID=1938954 RepID=A0A261XVS7_9FUNG|nr:hypothetical protein BZG36_04093 [Bifiguratus adelaidae]